MCTVATVEQLKLDLKYFQIYKHIMFLIVDPFTLCIILDSLLLTFNFYINAKIFELDDSYVSECHKEKAGVT